MTIPELYKKLELASRTITTDSRNVPIGSVFFALKGESFDGNAYADIAISQGAHIAVVDDPSKATSDAYVLVPDVLKILQDLAAYHRSQLSIPILVVGGSNGKTTTKELVRSVLATTFKTFGTKGNLNNHIGVPLSIFSIPKDAEIAVIEIGANHLGEHAKLCEIAQPTHVLVTNNGKDHLEGFGSYEGVCKANAEIYDYARTHGAHAFVISNQEELIAASQDIEKTTYGFSGTENYAFERKLIEHCAGISYQNEQISSQLVGSMNADNIAAATAVGLFFNVPFEKIRTAIAEYVPEMMRSQIVKHDSTTWIIDCYNANPTSMELGIRSFAETAASPRAIILGDMFEMGSHAETEHKKIVELAALLPFDQCIFIGKEFFKQKVDHPNFHFFSDRESAKEFIDQTDWNNFSVFIKGSRGMKLETLLPFPLKQDTLLRNP